ncbi:MAG: hypothetical protein A3E26_04745 [Chlamydiae bacterium RIFCSPHIGHO2_12_FULL_49_32]|nr:MAG: hypothetical protein A3E26_04745 [Chlamydiae bacterium RIFCSPHIGHO2_12_FULL_49_32]
MIFPELCHKMALRGISMEWSGFLKIFPYKKREANHEKPWGFFVRMRLDADFYISGSFLYQFENQNDRRRR